MVDVEGARRFVRGYMHEARRRIGVELSTRDRAPRPAERWLDADVICVYRRDNAKFVRSVIRDLPVCVGKALWALDAPAPGLEHLTIGRGPGNRFELLRELADRVTTDEPRPLVIFDDDIVVKPSLTR